MTESVKQGLGLLCIALIALLFSLALANPVASDAARLIAFALGVFGLVVIALGLFRRS